MADTYCRCGDPECPIHLGLSDNDKPSYFVRHAHTEYVEGCFRCDLSREETRDTTPVDAPRDCNGQALGSSCECGPGECPTTPVGGAS